MTTLVISTPWYKKNEEKQSVGKKGQSHSWETFFQTGKGLGYMLYKNEYQTLQTSLNKDSCKLVMIRQDKNKRRAEANLIKVERTIRKTKNEQWRYDVYFKDQKEVPYCYLPIEKLKENGVKVIT